MFETCGLALWSTRLLSPPLEEPLVPPPRPLARPLPPSRWPFGGDDCLLLFSPFSWILALLTLVLPFSFWSPWLPASLFVTLLLAASGGFAFPITLDLFSAGCRELLPRRESLTTSFLLSLWWYWLLPRLPRRPDGWTFAGFEWRRVDPGICRHDLTPLLGMTVEGSFGPQSHRGILLVDHRSRQLVWCQRSRWLRWGCWWDWCRSPSLMPLHSLAFDDSYASSSSDSFHRQMTRRSL